MRVLVIIRHEMGANVTKTPGEKLKIDETNDDFDDNSQNANRINGFSDDNLDIENHSVGQSTMDRNWNLNYGMSNLG